MLKPISSTSTAAVAWPHDPAFEATDEEIKQCAIKMLDDPGAWRALKVRPGERPTVFTIGVIPPHTLTLIEDQCAIEQTVAGLRGHLRLLQWQCFRRGVQGIEGFPQEWLYNAKEPPMVDPGGGMPKHLDPAWLELHFAGSLRQCALYVGGSVYRWQDLAGADVKNS